MSALVVKGLDFLGKAARSPKGREAIGKMGNILKGAFRQEEDVKENEEDAAKKANEDQVKQNDEAKDKDSDPQQPEKEPEKDTNEVKASTKFQDEERVRQEAREAINEDPEKAEGLSLGGEEKMENAQTIIENKDAYTLQGKLEDIRETAEKTEGRTWQDRFPSKEGSEKKSWQEIINEERGGDKSAIDKILEEKSALETKEIPELKEFNTTQDPSVNPAETQQENPTDINLDGKTDAPDTSGDRTDNYTYNPNESNEFAMLEAKEANFFNNNTPQVDLNSLNDQDMDKFSNLASDKEYTYEMDYKNDLDNVQDVENDNHNDLEDMEFYNDDGQSSYEDGVEMDMDGGSDGGGDD